MSFAPSTSESLPTAPPAKKTKLAACAPWEVIFDQNDVLQLILSHVGPNQYRFVALVDRRFRDAYQETFRRNYTTYLNVSTKEHARISWKEIGVGKYQNFKKHTTKARRKVFWRTVIHQGNLMELGNLRAADCPWDDETCYFAAQFGHLNVLKWCRDNGCPWDERTCAAAAENGHLEVLQWCRLPVNACRWDKNTCRCAARNGHLEVLQWCRKHGCPWDNDTCLFAARGGHLNVLQWCIENGCPWDALNCRCDARCWGHSNIVEWIEENNFHLPLRFRSG